MRKGARVFEPRELEADLEDKCRLFARRYGYRLIKLTAAIGDTDRLLFGGAIAPGCMFIEMKTSKGSMTPIQKHNRKELLKMSYPHMVIDNYNDFCDLIRELNRTGIRALTQYA